MGKHKHGLNCIQAGSGDFLCGVGDPRYTTRHKLSKWNVQPSVLTAARSKLTRRVFPGVSKAQHEQLARKYAKQATAMDKRRSKVLNAACKKLTGKTYQDVGWSDSRLGPLISGIVSERFTEKEKDQLRKLAHGASKLRGASVAHWAASGKRKPWQVVFGLNARG